MAESAGCAPTAREARHDVRLRVLSLGAAGWNNRQMGRRLGITERTVRRHLYGVYDLSGVRGKAQPRCGVNAGKPTTNYPESTLRRAVSGPT